MENVKKKNPLSFHIVKREQTVWYKGLAIRAAAVLLALVVSGIVITLLTDKNPLAVYKSMWNGAFGMNIRIWSLFQDVASLLCISLAVTPAFKMKFWNIGAEGQVLIGGLATVSVMMFLGGKIPLPLLLIIVPLDKNDISHGFWESSNKCNDYSSRRQFSNMHSDLGSFARVEGDTRPRPCLQN